MYPLERSLVKEYANRPFAIVGVNSDDDLALLKARIKEENITWRSFWCGRGGGWGRIPSQWGVRGWPTVYLIDHKGVIRHKNLNDKELKAAIAALVKEAEEVKSSKAAPAKEG